MELGEYEELSTICENLRETIFVTQKVMVENFIKLNKKIKELEAQ